MLAGALASATIAPGCATTGAPAAERRPSEEVLYDAMVAEAEARGWEVATASPRYRIVTTGYEELSKRLRVRRIMKIVVLPQGGALQVTVAYERDAGPDGEPSWEPIAEGPVREKAAAEELELGRAIERRFHGMR